MTHIELFLCHYPSEIHPVPQTNSSHIFSFTNIDMISVNSVQGQWMGKCELKFTVAYWSAYHWIPSYLLNLLMNYLMRQIDPAYICDAFQSDSCRIHLPDSMVWRVPVNLFY